jgi:hypothetical protein
MTDIARKVVARFLNATGYENFGALVEDALKVHTQLQRWLQRFPQELRGAVEESGQLAPGRVWAKPMSDLWHESGGYDGAHSSFRDLYESFGDLWSNDNMAAEIGMCQAATRIPREVQVERVMDTVGHEKEPPPGAGATWALSYDVATLEHWAKSLLTWSTKAEGDLKKALQSGKRKIKRQAR